jgi:xylulokinase
MEVVTVAKVALGIDLGTSSVKVVALDLDGRIVGSRQVGYAVSRPHPEWAEQDPDVWWTATCEALRGMLASGSIEVASVGVGGQMHGLVALGVDGLPVRPAIIWSDARSTRQVEAWADEIGAAEVARITGMPIATGMLGVSLTWIRDNEADVYRRTASVISPKDYIRFRLTGSVATEPTDAAGGLLYDIRSGDHSVTIADTIGLDMAKLPAIGATLAFAGEVTRAASDATGLPSGTVVGFGGGDQAMGALALGLHDVDRAAVAISSGGTVFKRTIEPMSPDRGLHVMPYVRQNEWMAMGVVLAAGLSLDWLITRVFGEASTPERISALMDQAARIPAGADGLRISPHVAGTRTPRVDAAARASIVGLGFAHGQAHLARALVEGVCLALSSSLTSMADAGTPAREIVVSGGGARFEVWRSTLADVSGLPVRVSSDLEHSAVGGALAGAGAAELGLRFDPAGRTVGTIDPDPAAHRAYQDVAAELSQLEHAIDAVRREED